MDQTNPIPIGKSPRHFPGKPPHISTIYRWLERGVRGIKLESFCVGSRRYVTQEAIELFIQRTTAAGPYSAAPSPVELSKERQRSIEEAERELDEAGI
jgi:hypothetical protein